MNLAWRRDGPGALLLAAVITGLFLHTVDLRRNHRQDALWSGHAQSHQYLTGSTLKFARIWWQEGALRRGFALLENPASPEFPDLASRHPYPSYPPGAVVPIHLLALATGAEPTPVTIHRWNLANQFALALILAAIAWIAVRQAGGGPRPAFCLALIPPLPVLLLPSTLYQFQQVYWADQAVLVPFALVVLLELIRDGRPGGPGRGVRVLQAAVLIAALATDWLAILVVVTLHLKRLMLGQVGRDWRGLVRGAVRCWWPVAAVGGLFVLQLALLGILPQLAGKFLLRTGLGADGGGRLGTDFWLRWIVIDYGFDGLLLLAGSVVALPLLLVVLLVARRGGRPVAPELRMVVGVGALLLLPCLLQVHALRQHSTVHNFAALKFLLPLAVVPMVLLPLAGAGLLRRLPLTGGAAACRTWALRLAPPLLVLAVATTVIDRHRDHGLAFTRVRWAERDLARAVRRHARTDDVVVSPHLAIPENPPLLLAQSMKRVHPVADVAAVRELCRPIRGAFAVLIIIEEGRPVPAGLAALVAAAAPAGQAAVVEVEPDNRTRHYRFHRLPGDRLSGLPGKGGS
jgi:hypothetical protein